MSKPHLINRWIQSTTTFLVGLILIGGLSGCGSGNSSSSSTPASTQQSSASSYWSSVSIGDFGEFNIDLAKGTFVFNFIDSAYGLSGTSIQGTVTADANGTYIGTTSNGVSFPIILKASYSLLGLPLNPNNLSDFTPVMSVNKNQAMTSSSQIRNAAISQAGGPGGVIKAIGYSCQSINNTPSNCIASTSTALILPGATDSELQIYLCDNGGRQDDNTLPNGCVEAYQKAIYPYYSSNNLSIKLDSIQFNTNINYLKSIAGTSAAPGTLTNWTATYNSSTNSWNSVNSTNTSSIRGVFAIDQSSSNLIGFFDTVDVTGIGYSGFKFFTNIAQTPTLSELMQYQDYMQMGNILYANVLQKGSATSSPKNPYTGLQSASTTINLNEFIQGIGYPFYAISQRGYPCSSPPPWEQSIAMRESTFTFNQINLNQFQVGGALGSPISMPGFISAANSTANQTSFYLPGNDGIGIGVMATTISPLDPYQPTTGNFFRFFYTSANQGRCY